LASCANYFSIAQRYVLLGDFIFKPSRYSILSYMVYIILPWFTAATVCMSAICDTAAI